jgi:hypothetical protein
VLRSHPAAGITVMSSSHASSCPHPKDKKEVDPSNKDTAISITALNIYGGPQWVCLLNRVRPYNIIRSELD